MATDSKGALRLPSDKIAKLRQMIALPVKRVVVLSHHNPDGDAVGSAMAWSEALTALGHSVTCVIPNKFPYFLDWIEGIGQVKIFAEHPEEVKRAVSEADIICFLDFNSSGRLEGLTEVVEGNTTARKLLIDHHLDPPRRFFDLSFSYPEASSTSYLVLKLILRLFGAGAIDRAMATALYVGMMTDTGNFSFSNLTGDLYRSIAVLVDKGIDIPYINYRIYNSYTEGRIRLLAHALGPKMELIQGGQAAYIALKESELRRFHFRQGDSEGFVNYPLSIQSVKMSALFLQTNRFIRVSLRSRGDVDVNAFARKYFGGGGHKNASGGKSMVSMEQTVAHFKKAVAEFFREEDIANVHYEEKK
jgi:phosphoesterase RecJ-like protein